MAVVKEGMIGNTKYKIYDDAYKNRTPEEIQGTLKRLGEMASGFYENIAAREAAEKGEENVS